MITVRFILCDSRPIRIIFGTINRRKFASIELNIYLLTLIIYLVINNIATFTLFVSKIFDFRF